MIGRSLVSGFLLISCPALCATALSIFGYLKIVPIYAGQERARVSALYREVAEDLKEHPEKGVCVIPAKRGISRSMKPGRWGYVEGLEKTTVWYVEGLRTQSIVLPTISPYPVASLLLSLEALLLVLFWGLTFAGCWMFRRSVKERDDFVAATAHDLTTPLVALRRFIGHDDDEAKAIVERMVRLVKNLTDFLKLGGRPKPVWTRVDVGALLSSASAAYRDDFRALLGHDVPIDGPTKVIASADETMLLQVFWNLLGNALKYAAPYGPVSVRFGETESRVHVDFIDEGLGLKSGERRRLFRRYYRAKSVLKSGKGGFGIGLCTARDFVRAMGGDLTVAPNHPQGCVFTVMLQKPNPV